MFLTSWRHGPDMVWDVKKRLVFKKMDIFRKNGHFLKKRLIFRKNRYFDLGGSKHQCFALGGQKHQGFFGKWLVSKSTQKSVNFDTLFVKSAKPAW